MARKTEYGKYILSAGEIGAYTVCPEAWRLSSIEKVETIHSENHKKGRELHRKWAESVDEASYLKHNARLLVILLFLTLLIVLIF
jgi:hypothetical protein